MSRLRETVRYTGASHLITLLTAGSDFQRPDGILEKNHLHLIMHDISEPREGMMAPDAGHVADILAFAARWDRSSPLVINCYAGISRSTAAAFVIWCWALEGRKESELADLLRKKAPSATPNRLIVSLGDEALGRGGRMVGAIDAIGRGADAFEGCPFVLEF